MSNYFNRPHLVSAEKRERIQAVVDELEFVPSESARQLRLQSSKTVGYIAFEVNSPYFWSVADSVERQASSAGWMVSIGNSLGSIERERDYIELFERQRVAGIIVAPIDNVEGLLAGVRKRGIGSVITGRRAHNPDQASVSVEDLQGGYLAVRHLIECGKKSIAFVGGPISIKQVSERLEGALRAVAESPGVELEVIPISDRTVDVGRTVARALESRDPGARPDGVFAVNDLVAFGMIQAFVASGKLDVPGDIAIVGYDDLDFPLSTISLTSIHTPNAAIGAAAFALATGAEAVGGTAFEGNPKHVVFEVELRARASTLGGSAATD